MKGLLVKDFRFAIQNKKMMVMLVLIEIVFLVLQEADGIVFIIGYMMMGCGMLALSTITTDEYNKSMAFLMALPIRRGDYAAEKYVFSLLCNLVGFFLAVVPCCLISPGRIWETLGAAIVMLAVMLAVQAVMLPMQLKYGGEKGRIVLLGAFVCAVLPVAWARKNGARFLAGKKELQEAVAHVVEGVKGLDGVTAGIAAVALCAVCFLVSLSVSKRIMEKKEF